MPEPLCRSRRRHPSTRYVGLVDAARELGIHPSSLLRIVRRGRISARKWGGKWLIEREVLEAFRDAYNPRPGVTNGKPWNQ